MGDTGHWFLSSKVGNCGFLEGPTMLESLVILKGSRLVLLTPVDLNESL